jgi:sulfotransferase family protein
MRLIGAGFGRTGTLSMKAALEMLGYGPCCHMTEIYQHPDRVPLFRAAAAGEPVDWDAVFAGYESTVDWPGVSFWRELVARYPDAKVLLTVRDPERWYASVRDSLLPTVQDAEIAAMIETIPGVAEGRRLALDLIYEREFGGRVEDPEHAMRVYAEHNAAVRREVPADRLLVYRVGDGWEPLCAFLGVPVPEVPFPHLNDGASFRARIDEQLAVFRAARRDG